MKPGAGFATQRSQDNSFGLAQTPRGREGSSIGEGWGTDVRLPYGGCDPATLITREARTAGVKDAGSTGARPAPPGARAGLAVSVTDESAAD